MADGNAEWCSHCGKWYGVSLKKKKIKQRNTPWSSTFTSGFILKGRKIRDSGICTPTFIAALFVIAKRWRQFWYLLMEEGINKTWHIHAIEYHSAWARKEILSDATVWMNLEDIVLSESPKDKLCLIPFIQGTWNSQIHRDRKDGGCQGLGRRNNRGLVCYGYRVSDGEDGERVLETDGGDGHTIMWICFMPQNCAFENS